jgi:type I restriction enzyme S subunit
MELRTLVQSTELGDLPVDWSVQTLRDLGKVHDGTHQTPRYVRDGVPFYSVEHVTSGDFNNTKFISIEEHRFLTRTFRMEKGDVLMTRIGSIGECRLIDWDVNASFYVSLALLKLRNIDAGYVAQYSNSPMFKQEVELHSLPSAVPKKINLGPISDIRIAVPPPEEQHAIATALSDVDALIAGLERLIAKKRDIKQAAMQQLLTGQTRLPGFSGEWVSHRLGDNAQFLKNGVNARAELTETGNVKYLHYGDIHGAASVFLDADNVAMPHLPALKAAKLDRLQDGDLVFADASEDKDGIGKAVELRGIGEQEVVSGLHTIATRFDKSVLADGFKAYLQFMPPFSRHLKKLAAGTKVYATNRRHIASAELRLPGTAEQTVIATVLSDMDADLTALESRLAKTRAIKQGMMQELLTGRTRLV